MLIFSNLNEFIDKMQIKYSQPIYSQWKISFANPNIPQSQSFRDTL